MTTETKDGKRRKELVEKMLREQNEQQTRIKKLEAYLANLAMITPHKWLKEEIKELLKTG